MMVAVNGAAPWADLMNYMLFAAAAYRASFD